MSNFQSIGEILSSPDYQKHLSDTVGAAQAVCPDCRSTETRVRLQIIPTNRPEWKIYPLYVPQVRRECAKCHKWITFERQTPELIEFTNQLLERVGI